MPHTDSAYSNASKWGIRKSLIYNVRKPEQDQTARSRLIWQYAEEGIDGLFDNPNGRNDTWPRQGWTKKN
jgi:hypothetical protein